MCGITGWVSFDRDLLREETLDRMTETMACRGSDASDTWTSRHATLDHWRLAVTDLHGGMQPMSIETPNDFLSLLTTGGTKPFRSRITPLTACTMRCGPLIWNEQSGSPGGSGPRFSISMAASSIYSHRSAFSSSQVSVESVESKGWTAAVRSSHPQLPQELDEPTGPRRRGDTLSARSS